MALLDLQGLEPKPSSSAAKGGKGNSGSSKGCTINVGGNGGGGSHLSLLLC
jgi:hypothetical protein